RDEERATGGAHRLEGGEEQGRLAHAGLPADPHEGGRDEPAAEDAVELGHAGGDPLGLGGGDVDEAEERLGRRRHRREPADDLLHERAERGASWALPEPAAGAVSALGARVLDRSLGHDSTLRTRADGFVTSSCPTKKRLLPQGAAFLSVREGRAPAASGPRSLWPHDPPAGPLDSSPFGWFRGPLHPRRVMGEKPQGGSASAPVAAGGLPRTMTFIQPAHQMEERS